MQDIQEISIEEEDPTVEGMLHDYPDLTGGLLRILSPPGWNTIIWAKILAIREAGMMIIPQDSFTKMSELTGTEATEVCSEAWKLEDLRMKEEPKEITEIAVMVPTNTSVE